METQILQTNHTDDLEWQRREVWKTAYQKHGTTDEADKALKVFDEKFGGSDYPYAIEFMYLMSLLDDMDKVGDDQSKGPRAYIRKRIVDLYHDGNAKPKFIMTLSL